MSESTIGGNIAELRKSKGVTQENLADAVGLTAQAVSKWESGGSPDTSLLPAIADYFGVTIDRLFGRKVRDNSDMPADVRDYIAAHPFEERINAMYQICFHAFFFFMDMPENSEFSQLIKNISIDSLLKAGAEHGINLLKTGFVKMGISGKAQYFLLMPEPEKGWQLDSEEELCKFFSLLSDKAAMKSLIFLHSRQNKGFTSQLLEKEFEISREKAEYILAEFANLKLVKIKELEIDDRLLTTYEFEPNVSIIPFLIFANELIIKPNSFFCSSDDRDDRTLLSPKEVLK